MATTNPSTVNNTKPVSFPSCLECKSRKVKCDRKSPCGPCIKRGTSDQCKWTWNDSQVDPKLLFRAVDQDHGALLDRLADLEAAINALPAEIRGSSSIDLPRINLPSQLSTLLRRGDLAAVKAIPPKKRQRLMSSEHHADSDAELAARSLESFAAASDVGNGLIVEAAHEPAFADKSPHLTSIYDATPRSAADNAYCGTILDTGLSLNPTINQAHRDLAMDNLLALLPSPIEMQYLYGLFLDKVHWRFRIIDPELLSTELQQYYGLASHSWHRRTKIDPLWLAVCFAVFALALGSYSAKDSQDDAKPDPFQHHTSEQIDNLTRTYHNASVKALHLGDYMGKPRVRTIQVVILLVIFFQQYLQPSAGSSSPDRMLQWLTVGIRTAQMLGLDMLGEENKKMPPDDIAWPPGCNALKRQMALRLWMNLEWSDWMTTRSSKLAYIIDPHRSTTKLVDNLNDSEVSASHWQIQPHPDNVLTTTAFEVVAWHIANTVRKTFDKSLNSSSPLSYDDTLELDGHYQKMLNELPLLRSDFDSQPKPSEYSIRQHCIALIGVHSQIARLHRPFLSQSYTAGSPFALSNERCLSSARKVVECHDKVKTMTSRGIFWFAYSHTFNAAIVLFLDLFWSIDHTIASALLNEKRHAIEIIQKIFSLHSDMGNISLRGMLETGEQIISGLLLESDDRRQQRAAHPTGQLASFADIMRKVVHADLRRVNPAADAHAGQQSLRPHEAAPAADSSLSGPISSSYQAGTYFQHAESVAQPSETADPWEFPDFYTNNTFFASFPGLEMGGDHLHLHQLMGHFSMPSRSSTPFYE